MYLQYGKSTHAAGFTARLNEILHRLAQRVGSVGKAFEGHKAARRMSDLDDRILSDIGLTRDDVDRAVHQPLMIDPRADLAQARRYRINGIHRPIRRRR